MLASTLAALGELCVAVALLLCRWAQVWPAAGTSAEGQPQLQQRLVRLAAAVQPAAALHMGSQVRRWHNSFSSKAGKLADVTPVAVLSVRLPSMLLGDFGKHT
jgi:hypothetical protein